MKQFTKKILIFMITLSTGWMLCSYATASVVQEQTPIDSKKGGTIWTRSFSTGGTSYNSVPVVTDSALYVVNENILYELDLKGNILRKLTLSKKMNSVCHMILQDKKLYIPLSGGVMECVDVGNFSSLWISETFGGQSLSKVIYYNGYVYAGTTTIVDSSSTKGIFFCLDAKNGKTIWTYEDTEDPGGYYWSGAVVAKNRIYFSGDNGRLVSHSLLNSKTYEILSLTTSAKIRAGLILDEDDETLYTASNDGILHKIFLSDDGSFGSVKTLDLYPGATDKNCTSTPVICNNRMYIGSFAEGYGYLSVIDLTSFTLRYRVRGNKSAEIKATPLVSTGYATEGNQNKVYIYVTYNAPPGGIYYMEDSETATTGSLQTLYIPFTAKQFCISSIVSGKDGTLYYSNDSGTLFAVREVNISSDRIPTPSPTSSTGTQKSEQTASPVSPKTETITKPKKPSKIKVKKKKKKGKKNYTITWKKNTKNSQTLVYIRQNSGSWKKHVIKKKSSYSFSSTRKKIQIRLRSRYKQKGKWIYSSYTKTKKLS